MIIARIGILNILGLIGSSVSFPTSIDDFYQTLHKKLTPKQSTGTDGCQIIANQKVVQYQEAIDCYNSFPLVESVRRDTLVSLEKILEFYVFKDIIENSPDKNVPSNINLEYEWRNISNYKFNTEFEFNSLLKGYFNSFHDGHTAYNSKCYSSFVFIQPFPIYIHNSEVRILSKIKLDDRYIKKWSELGLEILQYEGAQVLKINNMEPIEYMKLYSHFYIGVSRDINSRLNIGSARVILTNGDWGITHGMFASTSLVPLNSTVDYSLKTLDGETHEVRAPYLVKSPGGFQDSNSYYKKHCKLPVENSAKQNDIMEEVPEVRDAPINQALIKPRRSRRDIKLQLLTTGPAMEAYLLGESTGVLVLTDFSGGSEDWFTGIDTAFNEFKSNKVKKLILDLSNNGGGIICRGYHILNGLFPGAKQFTTDMRSNPLLRELTTGVKSGYFSPSYYNKPDGTRFNSTDAFKIRVSQNRGYRSMVSFTPKFQDRCKKKLNPFPITFVPKDIIVVTNTICYSTCTLLVNSLQQLYNVTTYALGGDPYLPAPPSSLAGGSVIDFDLIRSQLEHTSNFKGKQPLGVLPEHASFRFTFREAYSHNHTDRPLEFTFLPAHHRLPYDSKTINHPKFIWDIIEKKLANDVSSYYEPVVKKEDEETYR